MFISITTAAVGYICVRGSQEIHRKYHEWKSNKKNK